MIDFTAILHSFPISFSDLQNLSEKSRSADIFTPSFSIGTNSPYSPKTYLLQKSIYKTQTILVADRNLFSRWVAMIRGCKLTEQHRLAAGTLAFCQCCDILIDPCIALHEIATQSGNDLAREEEKLFRIADNTTPAIWSEIALGKNETSFFPIKGACFEEDNPDFAKPLKIFHRNYIIALKLAAIALRPGRSKGSIEEFFNWMFTDFIFMGGPTILGLCYFAPNGIKKGLIKQLRSPDRNKAILGIRNATWDMTIVTHWLAMVKDQKAINRLVILGSFDKMLHVIARSMLSFSGSDEKKNAFGENRFQELWGRDEGKEIWRKLQACYEDSENPERSANKDRGNPTIDELIEKGEKEILEWSPN